MKTSFRLALAAGVSLLPLSCVVKEKEVITAPAADGCYVQIFDDEDFDQSDPHTTIAGPAQLPDLEDVSGDDWGGQIESLVVGPGARVRAWKGRDFTGAALDFEPGQRIARLGEYDFADQISSLQVTCDASGTRPVKGP